MGTWYTNEADFLNAVTAYSYSFENSELGAFPDFTYITPDGNLTAVYPDEIILFDGAKKGLFRASTFTTSNYNAIGIVVNIVDYSLNLDSPQEILAFSVTDDDTILFTPDNSTFFIGYIFSNFYENDLNIDLYEVVPNNLITEKIYLGIDGSNSLDPNITSVENLSTTNILYSENYFDLQSISSEEYVETNQVYAESYLEPLSINTAESFQKHIIYPKPFPGAIYFWYEIKHTIETELNSRVQS